MDKGMKQIHSIHVIQDAPGFAGTYVEIRYQDESKGYKETEFGKQLVYDKIQTIRYEHNDTDFILEDIGNKITEVLCN